jgi:hypothetical protein
MAVKFGKKKLIMKVKQGDKKIVDTRYKRLFTICV